MDFTEEPAEKDAPDFDFPLIPSESDKALAEQHGRAKDDYETWKAGFLNWLYYEGKKPDRLEGFAEGTIRKTSYKTGQIMRWKWEREGYTTELTPEDADELMKQLGRHSNYENSNLNNFVKTFKRIFSYYNHEKGRSIDWECNYELSEPETTNRDYFRKSELMPLYEAALNHGAVKHYHNCSKEERDRLKGTLAQRFEKPKENITPHDFERANCFKIPSLVSMSLDMGLRPVEVGRAKMGWLHLDEKQVNIPKEDSSKNADNWECVLSNRTVRALRKWKMERQSYDEYRGTDAIWLNKKRNPYKSQPLNYLLDSLVEASEIEPAGRDLTWYSIRHGVATVWVDEEDLDDAREQLRHKRVKTTLSYSHSSSRDRKQAIESKI